MRMWTQIYKEYFLNYGIWQIKIIKTVYSCSISGMILYFLFSFSYEYKKVNSNYKSSFFRLRNAVNSNLDNFNGKKKHWIVLVYITINFRLFNFYYEMYSTLKCWLSAQLISQIREILGLSLIFIVFSY